MPLMRLEEFNRLSPAEQKKVYEQNLVELGEHYKELCRLGVWNENASKELKKSKGEVLLWSAKK